MSIVFPIEEDDRYRRYTASAGQKAFAVPFPFQQNEDVAILLQTAPSEYTEFSPTAYVLAGANDPSGGSFTMNVGRTAGDVILVLGRAILDRMSSIVTNGRFRSELIDGELDRIRIIQQEIARDNERAMKVDYGAPGYTIANDLADGELLMKSGQRFVAGPDASEIQNAQGYAQAASLSEIAAGLSANAAAGSAGAAAASATLAQKWATNAEDAEVVPGSGLFSAYHWYSKTLALYNSVVAGLAGAIHGATAKTAFVAADELGFWDSVSGALRKITLANFWAQSKWKSVKIGEYYFVNTGLVGVDIPPTSDPEVVFIELTAGLTGAGGFNNGKLTTESVTGSAPLVVATAVISVAGSPMNGQTINLLNTEGRILRPSASPNTKQDDQLQEHGHRQMLSSAGSLGGAPQSPTVSTANNGAQLDSNITLVVTTTGGAVRTGTETRMKNIGVKAYMRIK
ncbi:hypothetical protein ACIQUB_07285 [Rhizobium sp. NPDC090275]|uniref:hypothetical protein n=1 Tax=Rhizobium sp. NPDC090275 TaxID=3364498 RepID=UPI00383A6ADF